jgi:hypothetical protein
MVEAGTRDSEERTVNWQSRDDERVARALEGAPLHGREDRVVVALAERIREVPAATGLDAAPEFRAALRARVLAESEALLPRPRTPADAPTRTVPTTAGPPSAGGPGGPGRPGRTRPTQPSRSRHRRRRKAFAATALVIATLSVTTVAASGDALPGDALYGLKRRVQNAELMVARTDVDRGRRHLELARTRVQELDTAGVSARPGPLLSTLDDMDSETRDGIRLLSTAAVDGTDEGRLGELAAWTAEQRALLTAASARLPEGARGRAADSLALLSAVAARLEELRGSLGCDCPAAGRPDDLGPKPGRGGAAATTPPKAGRSGHAPGGGASSGPTGPAPGGPTSSRCNPGPSGQPAPTAAPATPAPTAEPPGPNPQPPSDPTTPVPQPPEQPDPTDPDPAPSPEPSQQSIPDVVTGVVGGLIDLLGLTK